MGSTCFQIFNDPFPYPVISYKRTIMIQEESGNKQLILAHQYANDDYIRLIQDTRKQLTQYLNINPVSTAEVTFPWNSATKSVASTYPTVGKWLDINSSSVFNYIEYDPTVPAKTKTISVPKISATAAYSAYSTNFDCVIISDSSATTAYLINSTAKTATPIAGWATLPGSSLLSQTDFNAAVTAKQVAAGPLCEAVQVGNIVYFQNSDGSAFMKSTTSVGFTTPVYDSSLTFAYSNGVIY